MAALRRRRILKPSQLRKIESTAASMYFPDRTWTGIAQHIHDTEKDRQALCAILERSHVQQKRIDAIQMTRILSLERYSTPQVRPDLPMTECYRDIRDRVLSTRANIGS